MNESIDITTSSTFVAPCFFSGELNLARNKKRIALLFCSVQHNTKKHNTTSAKDTELFIVLVHEGNKGVE
jgi:hypothetical protein